jgi:hypothetical protein
MYKAPSKPLPFEYSRGCIEFGILNALTPHTKYLRFLELLMALSEAVAAEILHCNNSGIRPPEAVTAGRFAYYPILILAHFC